MSVQRVQQFHKHTIRELLDHLPPNLQKEVNHVRNLVSGAGVIPEEDYITLGQELLTLAKQYKAQHQKTPWYERTWSWLWGDTTNMERKCHLISLYSRDLILEGSIRESVKYSRSYITHMLSVATSFPEELFSDLSDEDLNEFTPVVRELSLGRKASKDIKFALNRDHHSFAKFSRKIFTSLPRSLSLALIEDDEGNARLTLVRTYHKTQKIRRPGGTFKEAQELPQEGLYKTTVKRPELIGIEADRRKIIVNYRTFKAALVNNKLLKKYGRYLSLPTLASYINKNGIETAIYLSRNMNMGSLYRSRNQIPGTQIVSVLTDIARGLEGIHMCGMAHLDLHTSNVLIENVKGTFRARVSDFDLTTRVNPTVLERIKGQRIQMAGMNRADQEFGTLKYMSPERKREGTVLGHEYQPSDIYSLGMIINDFIQDPMNDLPNAQRSALVLLSIQMTAEGSTRPKIEAVVKELDRIAKLT